MAGRWRLGWVLLVTSAWWACRTAPPPPEPTQAVPVVPSGLRAIDGVVLAADGGPASGAFVVVVPAEATGFQAAKRAGTTRADDAGHFHFELPSHLEARLNASAGAGIATSGPATATPTLRLGTSGSVLSGVVRGPDGGVLANAPVLALPTRGAGQAWVTESDHDGRYALGLPDAQYYVTADLELDGTTPRIERWLLEGDTRLDLALERTPPPFPANAKPVVTWLEQEAVRLGSYELDAGIQDFARLAPLFSGVRVVGVGEATHGTHEHFRFKHRLFEYLVTRHGFTHLALEAGVGACWAVNAYVLRGEGDPRAALEGLSTWVWSTEELLALVEWMRAHNANPKHQPKVQFVGIDVQQHEATLAVLQSAELSAPERAQLERVLGQREHWVRTLRDGPTRDLAMADNLDWWLGHAGPGAKVMVWAHNGHVSFHHNMMYPLGMHLRQRHGRAYLAIGQLFDQGTFRARDGNDTTSRPPPVREHHVGPAGPRFVESVLAGTGLPRFVVDLRQAPQPWFDAVVRMRQADAVVGGEASLEYPIPLARSFDVLAYVANGTPSVPLQPRVKTELGPPK